MPISNDRPVMDVANDNYEISSPTVIPTGKDKLRVELAAAMGDAPPITYCAARARRGPNKWKPGKYTAANDNDVVPLPIVEALRRDGRESDIPWVTRYQMLSEVVGASPFDDEIDMSEEGISFEARSLKLSGKSFDKSFAALAKGGRLPGGEISYREPRQTVKQRVSVGQRTNPIDDEGSRTQSPLRLACSEDERIARMDGQPVLAALRAGIGSLLGPFEAAALSGETLTEIGDAMGHKWKARSASAKVAVYAAIDMLRDQWRLIDRQISAEAAACDRRVKARREELAADRAAYLGLAA